MSMSSSVMPWRTLFSLMAVLLVLLVSACASTKTSQQTPQRPGIFGATGPAPSPGNTATAPRPATTSPVPGRSSSATPLATEQRFLEDWFRGTPVMIAVQLPVTLQLDVPLVHAFDPGKSDIKPALNAVLERVAESLLRQSAARIFVDAPADAGGGDALADARAKRMRSALGSKGIASTRVVLAEVTRAGGPVQLVLTIPGIGEQPLAGSTRDRVIAEPVRGAKPLSSVQPAGWTEKKH
jgi:outer membrane protein OmpA-like peptidoglycan-associated protein